MQLGHLGQEDWSSRPARAAVVAYAVFDVRYLLFSVFLTTFVVALLELLGPAVPTAEARLLDTAIGSGLALLAYMAWPTWEGLGAQTKFASLIEAHRDYAVELLRALAGSSEADPPELRGLQVAARRARSDAEARLLVCRPSCRTRP